MIYTNDEAMQITKVSDKGMCKYCNFEFDENGECWNATRSLYLGKENLGVSAEIIQKVDLFVLANSTMRNYELNCEVSVGENMEDVIFDTYIPINYCPFCGRKLETEPNDNRSEATS